MSDWWQSLETRERMFVGGLGVFLALFMFYLLLVEPLFAGAAEYREKVATAEQDLAFMHSAAPQLKQQPQGARPAPSGTITVIIDQTRRSYNIAIDNTQQVGDDSLRVRIEDTSFDALVGWLGELFSQHGIATDVANIRQGDATGTANASLTLRRQ